MSLLQKLSILFYLKKGKQTRDGKMPIYVRISIDGSEEELSTGEKIFKEEWNTELKCVSGAIGKKINKKLRQIQTELEHHFDILKIKEHSVTPTLLKEQFKRPAKAEQKKLEKANNLRFSNELDALIEDYIAFNSKRLKAVEFDNVPSGEQLLLLEENDRKLKCELESLIKCSFSLFDNKNYEKTLMLSVNEYLLNFLQLCMSGTRSVNSLEKMIGRKRKFLSFIQYRYKADDLPLQQLEYNFITNLFKYLLTHYGVIENTAFKYCQCIKEIIDRSVANQWMPTNIFRLFKCSYTDPNREWLNMQQLTLLQNHIFEKRILNEVRDVFIFCCFTGLAYNEVQTLCKKDIITGGDNKKWISKQRQKTDNEESLPLLPPAIKLIEKYKGHPICVRRNRCLPVPSNQEYNRDLKEIASILNFNVDLSTHTARYIFANEVTYNNGVPLKTVSKMLSHSSVRTTEIYVRANKRNISENMSMVEHKLFGQQSKTNDDDTISTEAVEKKINNENSFLKVVHLSKDRQ